MLNDKHTTLIYNISELVTLSPLAKEKRTNHITNTDLGIIKNSWLCIKEQQFFSYGTMPPPASIIEMCSSKIDAQEKIILPGLVDSHTHPIYAGDRSHEFRLRLDGHSYEEIASKGGGILSTVKSTRAASKELLEKLCIKRMKEFLSYGVTTVEAKSGYGLSVSEELRHLQVLDKVKQQTPQKVISTCLALHAFPKNEAKSIAHFVKEMSDKLLPQVKDLNLAEYVDMFIEKGYFSAKDCIPFLDQAKKLGLKVRVHADEFSDSNGAQLAARWCAASADHLQFASYKNLDSMAKQRTIATILPGTSLYTKIPFTKAKKMIDTECSIAVASDHNPGSCLISNLPLLCSLAAIHCGLSSAQAIAAITYVASTSLGLEKTKGAICEGFDADCVLFPQKTLDQWLAQFGGFKAERIWIKGKEIKN